MSEIFSVQTVYQIILFLVTAKVIQWLIGYSYRVWIYSHVPGPFNIPFFGNVLQLLGDRSEFLKAILKLSKTFKNEPFYRVWIGPKPIISMEKPDHLATIFNAFNDKGDTYDIFHPWLKTGLLTSNGEKWMQRRKMITPSFHFDILKDYFSVMSEQCEIFVEKLIKLDKSSPICIMPHIAACTLDIICETAMGYSVNAQSGKNNDYVNEIHDMCDTLVKRQQRPWLASDAVFRFSEYGIKQRKCLKILHGFTKKVIMERSENFEGLSKDFGNSSKRKRIAFLDMLLDVKQQNSDNISFDDIQEEVDTFMFEGHDTTTAAINWTFFSIATHPEVQKKIDQELKDVLNDSKSISMDDLSKLTYLECVIKESMRLFPPVPFIGRKISEDTVVAGHKLLKDTDVFVIIYQVHRDERYFPEPEEFKPERFLPQNNLIERHPYAYIPFSFGKRNCIGQRFAMLETKLVLASLLRNFEFECNQKINEINPSNEVILRPENDILFSIKTKKKF